ncbi:MAG: oxidoreductase [Pseudonocardia sp.]|nr:oxidoreductase [Pseudonocardia sp.]
MTHAEPRLELLVKQMTWESDGVLSLALVDPDGKPLPGWTPGAHIDLTLRGSLVRQYSLCGDPADTGRYRVAVLREQAALGGSEFVHEGLRPGHRLQVAGPRNNFAFLPARRYVFIAGGIGITPILGMIRTAEAAGADWELHYGGRRRASMAFLDELAAFGDRVHVLPEDEVGRLDLAAVLPGPVEGVLVYCCGPEGLLAAVEQHTADWAEGCLQVERFKAKTREAPEDGERSVQVVAQRSGTTVEARPDCSLLDALEAAGIAVPNSCRDGICGTCETRVLDGVPDHRDSLLSAAEQAAGKTMMVCVSRAKSDRLVLDL